LNHAAKHQQEAVSPSTLLSEEEISLVDSLDRSGQLKRLTVQALQNNRDYRIAKLRVDQARAEYGIAKADRLPTIQATGQMERQEFDKRSLNEIYGQRYSAATIGISNFEIDFFERVKSLSDSAQHQYFATELWQQAARKALIAEVAQQYLLMRAEAGRKETADDLLKCRKEQVSLAQGQLLSGAISNEDLQAVVTQFAEANQQSREATRHLASARNALELITGYIASINTVGEVPSVWEQDQAIWLTNLHSTKLLERFDVQQAEEQLKADNASIGAARAAFFPSVSMSTSTGIASKHLHDLFSEGTGTWLFVPQINIPLFDGGRNQANLDSAKARKEISVANYEKVVQNAFKDMVDGFAERDALMHRIRSQSALNDIAQEQLEHRKAQVARGDASKFEEIAAQIQAAQSEQALIDTKLAIQMNLLSLYRVLYGADASAIPS
jgi:multidrug efflux system outer membrane protein